MVSRDRWRKWGDVSQGYKVLVVRLEYLLRGVVLQVQAGRYTALYTSNLVSIDLKGSHTHEEESEIMDLLMNLAVAIISS